MSNARFDNLPGGSLQFSAPTALGVRLLGAVFGSIALLVPLPFLLQGSGSPGLLGRLLQLAVIALSALGAWVFWGLALMPGQQLRFDASTRRIQGRAQRGGGLVRRLDLGFDEVQAVALEERPTEDRPFWQIRLELRQGPPMRLGVFDDAPQAEAWRARLRTLLGQADHRAPMPVGPQP